MKGYIYLITNLITNKQYIGQTINTIEQRFSSHISSTKYNNDNMYIHKSMKKYGVENFKVDEIKCIETDEKDDLIEELNYYEKYYISLYNTLCPSGYNMTKGGNEGSESMKLQVDEYDLCGTFVKTHDSIIDASRSCNASTGTAIRKCCYGKSKFAFQRIWRFHGDDLNKYELPDIKVAQRNYKLAPVDQYSLDGELLNTFSSTIEASNSINKDNSSHISECCNGRLQSAFGYVWRYHGSEFDRITDNRNILCDKFDLDGNFIERFNSLKDACLSVGKYNATVASNIRRCCKGERKTAYKYKWKFVN